MSPSQPAPATFEAWRSPPPKDTPLIEPSSLPRQLDAALMNGNGNGNAAGKNDLLHPSFLPPCEHGDDGDMHAHAFDLLSLSTMSPAVARPPLPQQSASTTVVPASLPNSSGLSATRPPISVQSNGNAAGSAPKPRRMSSSTSGVLGRGKSGLIGDNGLGLGGLGKDVRTSSTYTPSAPIPNRRPTLGSSPTPQLFDFAKTDRRPSHSHASRSVSTSTVPASLPNRSVLTAHAARQLQTPAGELPGDDMELDMDFDGDMEDEEGDEEGGSGRSGSAEIEEGMEGDDDWKKLALGTGSGGVKGRRKGMVFKCENCSKEYRHPSCLIKHRWEHSPHWKEPTQLSMSKHQQVQMLEAAAILAHLDPTQRRALPHDRSLWPAVLSPSGGSEVPLPHPRRMSQTVRSPSSTGMPLTPSSLRETSTLADLKPRKSSPGSDSTTSSMGEGYNPAQPSQPVPNRSSRPVGISPHPAPPSSLSSALGPGTPQSAGSSLPDMAGLHFYSAGTPPSSIGVSPIPNRGMPLSLKARAGLVGGGMFGTAQLNTARPSSSVRSGAMDDDEDEEGELVPVKARRGGSGGGGSSVGRGKSSSEEAEERRKGREGEEWGMAMEMEL